MVDGGCRREKSESFQPRSVRLAVLLLVVCPLPLCREASFPSAVCLQAKPGRWFSLRLHTFVSTLDFVPDESTELR